MSHNHTQPEESDIVLMGQNESDIATNKLDQKNNRFNDASQKNWHASYIPPYRAAYFGIPKNTIEAR